MKTLTYSEAFFKAYNGQPNFMTPVIIDRITTDRFYVELSTGSKFMDLEMYGVTVLDKYGNKYPELSDCFNSLEDAKNHINSLPC